MDEGIELMKNLVKFKVTSMPDFFMDRIVRVPSQEIVMNQISDKIAAGGGSIRNMLQMEVKGGNSVNTSYALAKLGINVELIVVADKVFTTANENNVITYFAPADLAERRVELPALFTRLKENLKILSLNENEARVLAKALSCEHLPLEYLSKDITRAARNLNKRTTIDIDIHTPIGSASANGEETFFEETYKISQNSCTGAGDVWDAANIGGYLLALDPNIRLKLANAAAGSYVSSKNMEAPSKEQLFAFLER